MIRFNVEGIDDRWLIRMAWGNHQVFAFSEAYEEKRSAVEALENFLEDVVSGEFETRPEEIGERVSLVDADELEYLREQVRYLGGNLYQPPENEEE